MSADRLTFDLKLDHRNRLVHPKIRLHLRLIRPLRSFQRKTGAGIVFVHAKRKCRKRKKIDPIPVFQNIQIPITCTDPDHIGNTGLLPCCRSHPENIMVSPLDINRMIVKQPVHDQMRTRSPVINIPDNVQMIYHKTLDQIGDRHNKFPGAVDPDHGHDDRIIVGFFVVDLCPFRDQLFDHICEIFRQCLAHLGTGILARRTFAHFDQTVQMDHIPVLHVRLRLFYLRELFFRIIDQRCQFFLISLAQCISKHFVDLPSHRTGTIF